MAEWQEATVEAERAPLVEHLRELRYRLVLSVLSWFVGFIVCYVFAEDLYAFLVQPLAESFGNDAERKLIYTSLTETFLTYIHLSFVGAFFVAFPLIAAQFYLFLAPGLYHTEKRLLVPYLLISPALFFAGAALAYYFVIPMAWAFFISFEEAGGHGAMPIVLEAKVGEYLSLVTQIIFAFGLAFQMPVVLTLLARIGVIQASMLRKSRKYAVVILITAAAFLTPPDVLSQIGLFIPLYFLYEISILACALMEKRHEQAAAE